MTNMGICHLGSFQGSIRTAIDNYHKQIAAQRKLEEKTQKVVEHQAKKAEKEAEKARTLAEWMATLGGHGRAGCCRREIIFTWVSPEATLFRLFQLFVGNTLEREY